MDQAHYNELVQLSRQIYDEAAEKLTGFCSARYCGIGNDTTEQQMEDYLFVAEQAGAYFLGNALALLDPASREAEIESFVSELRRVTAFISGKLENGGEQG